MKTAPTLHLALALLLAGTAAADTTAPEDVQGPLTWGAVSNVTHLGKLWFSGQPDRAGITKQGIIARVRALLAERSSAATEN